LCKDFNDEVAIMFRSILVPLDGSSFAEHALAPALTIARRANASLTLVLAHVPLSTVYATPMANVETTYDPLLKEHEHAYLNSVAERVKSVASVPVQVILAEGVVADTLQRQVETAKADLVVMTTHGRGALARFWLGSVADDLLRKLSVPILLIKPGDGPADFGTEVVFRHTLIALDGSPWAEEAIEAAVALGSTMNANYMLLRVVRPPAPWTVDYAHASMTPQVRQMLDRLRILHEAEVKEAGDYLDKIARSLAARSLKVQTRVVSAEQTASAILEAAQSGATNLIAVATHGRRGIRRMVLGSVADKVVRGASAPVLVYRPQAKNGQNGGRKGQEGNAQKAIHQGV
jgi:nucleotide-binding universal stress UspA family protein